MRAGLVHQHGKGVITEESAGAASVGHEGCTGTCSPRAARPSSIGEAAYWLLSGFRGFWRFTLNPKP